LLGLNREETINAVSLAWVDGQSLRTYRHAPNTGSRKSWAAGDYEDGVARDPRIDALRAKMFCVEDKKFTRDYHAPDKRSIANALTVEFKDGSKLDEVVCEYPIGHKRRRQEGMPVLVEKFRTNLARRFPAKQAHAILKLCLDANKLDKTPVDEFVDLFVI
jgi:2-methylcitrate dehydratase